MKQFLIAFLFTFLFFCDLYAAEQKNNCLGKTCFEEEIYIEDNKLLLKGLGLFEHFGINIYTAAFYAPEYIDSQQDILNDYPKTLIIHYHRTIKPKRIIKSSEKKLKKNLKENYALLEEKVNKIGNAYRVVKNKDRYLLTYTPGSGTTLRLNNEELTSISGFDFHQAYFGLWLSESPISQRVRKQLLKDFEV